MDLAEGPASLRHDPGRSRTTAGRGCARGPHGRCRRTWLTAHPGITTISRDRHGPYAEAVRRGAPQAIQVADRFHLVLNLRGAVEQELSRQRRFLVVTSDVVAMATGPKHSPVIVKPRRRPLVVVDRQRHAAQERRTGRLERFGLVKQLQAAGYTAPAIMRETGFGRAAVRKWVRLRELPPRNRMTPQPGMPAFFREYLQRRWTEGCQSAKALMAEIQPLGFVGCYTGLAKLLAPWREPAPRCETPIDDTVRHTVPLPCVPVRHISPQIAAALLSQPRPLLSVHQAEIVALKAGCLVPSSRTTSAVTTHRIGHLLAAFSPVFLI